MKLNINILIIKSFYNLKKIFSFISTNKKLELISYNKTFQKLFGIDIETYKQVSKRYKIVERNEEGKEYLLDKNIIIFEGNYING